MYACVICYVGIYTMYVLYVMYVMFLNVLCCDYILKIGSSTFYSVSIVVITVREQSVASVTLSDLIRR